jgi:hypothetical protein
MYCYCYWLSSVAAVTALLLLPKSSSAIDDASARSVTRTRTRNDSKRFDLNEYINFLQDGRDADADGIGISIEDDELPIIDFEVSYWQQDDELPNTLLFDEVSVGVSVLVVIGGGIHTSSRGAHCGVYCM